MIPDGSSEGNDRSRTRLVAWLTLAWLSRLAFVVLGIVATIGVLWLAPDNNDASNSESDAEIEAAVSAAIAGVLDGPTASAAAYQAILPSLVYIRTTRSGDNSAESGVGSGVIINQDGSILTAYHVVEGAARVEVTFADGTRASAHVASSQPEQDLAILTSDAGPEIIIPAVLAGSGRVQVGDVAFVVANPLGFVASMSAGVISGLDRQIQREDGEGTLDGLIQFDAAVNPGSSGGPLLNQAGQVVGIVTALVNPSSSDSFTGIGFAVPLEAAGGGADGPPR